MAQALERIGSVGWELLYRFFSWHLRGWREAWSAALNEPRPDLRVTGLVIGLVIICALVPANFRDLGLMGGASYLVAVYLAMSKAIFFRIVRVRRSYVPLGIVAPLCIHVGVIGSKAIRPLFGDFKDAAMAQDFITAAVILAVFAGMTIWFRAWQSGNPY